MSQHNNPWIHFYHHSGHDHRERSLIDIWTMTYDELEKHHDFIQWLFPLPEPSPVNPHAPILDSETLMLAHQSNTVQENLVRSFDTMAAFWGFNRLDDGSMIRSGQFNHQSKKWCTPSDHNQLRITRMLKCLTLTGQVDLACSACDFLLNEINQAGFSFSDVPSVSYWMLAVETDEDLELSMSDFEADH